MNHTDKIVIALPLICLFAASLISVSVEKNKQTYVEMQKQEIDMLFEGRFSVPFVEWGQPSRMGYYSIEADKVRITGSVTSYIDENGQVQRAEYGLLFVFDGNITVCYYPTATTQGGVKLYLRHFELRLEGTLNREQLEQLPVILSHKMEAKTDD